MSQVVDCYRVTVRTLSGVTVMSTPFALSTDWEEYWRMMTKDPESLKVFAGVGKIILSKECLSPAGNWEAYAVIPMEVS